MFRSSISDSNLRGAVREVGGHCYTSHCCCKPAPSSSKSPIIMEMQIKTEMRYHITCIRIATIKKNKQKTNSVSEDVQKLEPIVGVNIKWHNCYRKQYEGSSRILKQNCHMIQKIPLLGIQKKNVKQGLKELFVYPCSQQHYNSQQLKCGNNSNAHQQINEMQYVHIMEYFSALKRKDIYYMLRHG